MPLVPLPFETMPSGFDREAHLYDCRRGPAGPGEVEALLRVFEKRTRLLDVGGGTGRFALPLTGAGKQVTLLDSSRGMLEQARAKNLPSLVKGDACHMPFKDKEFEGTLFVLLLHLVGDWVQAVNEIGRVTDGPVTAVVTSREPELRHIYCQTRSDLGFATGKLDTGVAHLMSILSPKYQEVISQARPTVNATKVFEGFEPSASAPSGVHALATKRIEERFGKTTLEVVETVSVVSWSSETFRDFHLTELSGAPFSGG